MSDSKEPSGAGDVPDPPRRAPDLLGRTALGLAVANTLLLTTIAAVRWLRDGSFWLDEASIALNLLLQTPGELLCDAYPTGHSFPRLYLAPIALLMDLLGYHTMLLRLLPLLAFVAGALAWNRLVYLRFRGQPTLQLLAIVLNLCSATWLAYSVMLKQYSLDSFLALLPFLLSDAFFERHLREGRQRRRLIALALPCLFSFSYVIPLLARVAGWYVWGLRRGERRLDAAATGIAGSALAGSLALLWLIDLRHTATNPKLLAFWAKCIPSSDFAQLPRLLGNFFGGWYRVTPFGAREALPESLIALLLGLLALGSLAIAWRMLAGRSATTAAEGARLRAAAARALEEWGGRGPACVIVVLGAVAASLVVQYPLCSGRLTLFALFPLQLITLEGLVGVASWLPGRRTARLWLALAPSLLAALCLPAAWRSASWLLLHDTPENIRPLLHHIETDPSLPIVVAACSTKQISTLPEWLDRDDIVYYDDEVAKGNRGYPDARTFWLVSTGTGFYCPWYIRSLEAFADEIVPYHTPENTAALLKVTLPARTRSRKQ